MLICSGFVDRNMVLLMKWMVKSTTGIIEYVRIIVLPGVFSSLRCMPSIHNVPHFLVHDVPWLTWDAKTDFCWTNFLW